MEVTSTAAMSSNAIATGHRHPAHIGVERRDRGRFKTARVAAIACIVVLASCGAYRPAVKPSEGHLSQDRVAAKSPKDKILPPVTVSDYVPPPKPRAQLPTYSVVVNEVPVKELLFALARDTKQNIDVHPNVQGVVSISAINETLPAILERISDQSNIRYRIDGKNIAVVPDTPYFRTYRVNYVNVARNSSATIGVSGDITTGNVGSETNQQTTSNKGSQTTIDSLSEANFWGVLRTNLGSLLRATRALTETQEQKTSRIEAIQRARQERIAQAQAVSGAGGDASGLFNTAFGPESKTEVSSDDEVVINALAGTVSVLGTERQHQLVQAYIDGISASSQRQVLIEATIAEVRLSNNYQAGVDWSRIATGTGFTFNQSLQSGFGAGLRQEGNNSLLVGYANTTSSVGNIAASIKALEEFGNTRVLSSPKLMALNNQQALLKVVDNVVYFEVESQVTTSSTGPSVQTFDTKAKTVAVGLVMSVLPQIADNNMVSLTVRPTISRIIAFKNDPNPDLVTAGVTNPVPEIQVREMESMLQVGSGQTVVLGGLMQDNVRRDRDQVPIAGSLPAVGDAFAFRDEAVSKTELVIFLKPTVVTNPSLDSDQLQYFQRFLPAIDPSGRQP